MNFDKPLIMSLDFCLKILDVQSGQVGETMKLGSGCTGVGNLFACKTNKLCNVISR